MFIRIKKVKKYEYAYLVQNKWKKRNVKGSRQQVKEYLGKVLKLEKTKERGFLERYEISKIKAYVKKNKRKHIISDLIEIELLNHGFSKKECTLSKEDVVFDLKAMSVIDKKKEKKVVLKINDGFLCNHSIKKLLEFKHKSEEYEKQGYRLAKAFIECGINIPKELFVEIYNKF